MIPAPSGVFVCPKLLSLENHANGGPRLREEGCLLGIRRPILIDGENTDLKSRISSTGFSLVVLPPRTDKLLRPL